jgi:GH15 family glucan-1,4-alpha-glucosidase
MADEEHDRPYESGRLSTRRVEDHALLSDRHSAALVTLDGTIDWLCFPRFDSPSVFGSLLDDEAGHWSIRPAGAFRVTREYVKGSMALRTTFESATGRLEILDAMALGRLTEPHRMGQHAPHTLLRNVRCVSGQVSVEMCFRPRPEYGLIAPQLTAIEGGVVSAGGPGRLMLSSPLPLHPADGVVRARFDLRAGERAHFAARHTMLEEPMPMPYTQHELADELDATIAGWQAWSALHQNYDGPWRELVHHSGRVLEALSYQPTGAIVAAATTSLPEQVGGQRNWDYRYAWVRDASLTMQALWVAACPDEAYEFFDFMTTAAADARPDQTMQIMFGVGGERDLSERTLPHLAGWRASWPVRVGNGAWAQEQLDVYGELLDSAWQLREQLGGLAPNTRTFLAGLADAAAREWEEPDSGIWEVRGAPRHFLYSKLRCWVALDRAVTMAEQLHATDRAEYWAATAQRIRTAILTYGWHPEVGAFTQSFGAPDLDAAVLMVPIVGFLPATDPRVLSTIDVIAARLADPRGLIYRYRSESGVDGLTGAEGTFLMCTFWLAHALAMAGRIEQARQVFERAVRHANDVGLLAEEIDPADGSQLGNFPQAFSHIGLVNAAWAIQQAEQRRDEAG